MNKPFCASILKPWSGSLLALSLLACAPLPPQPDRGHIQAAPAVGGGAPIPAPVQATPILEAPRPAPPTETYSVVGTGVPVRDMLFALARDAGINVDIRPDVSGTVTINAIDQTLPQILDRISRQVDIRVSREGDTLFVEPDRPYLQNYKIDYVNMSRDNSSSVSVATQIATTGEGVGAGGGGTGAGGSNNSTTDVVSTSNHRFWERLQHNVRAMLGDAVKAGDKSGSTAVIANPEAGLLSVRATARQHRQIRKFIDHVLANAQRQVLIEATVVEVRLNDDYQLGVDWSHLASNGTGLSFDQSLLGLNLSKPPFSVLSFTDPDTRFGDLSATVRMLKQFGDVKVLSSPKIMAINNQTAVLKVVDNLVYFTLEADTTTGQTVVTTTFTSTVHTVPVGFVMSVTPAIDDNDVVTLNIRPTISRVTGFVTDPNPSLASVNVESRVPEIQVREMDSVLRIHTGQTAVLGGLIQDRIDLNKAGLPGLSDIPRVGEAFSYRNNKIEKTELVIFLRPRVIHDASINGDLAEYRDYLPDRLAWPDPRADRDGTPR